MVRRQTPREEKRIMKKITMSPEKPASHSEPVMQPMPEPDPPQLRQVHKVVLRVGGKRYEFSHHMEVREITKGPATVIEMPSHAFGAHEN